MFEFLPKISVNYIYQIEILVLIGLIVFVLYIFYSLNLFRKQ